MTNRLALPVTIALIALIAASAVRAADAPLDVLEPAKTSAAEARKPERARWSWNQAPAEVTPTGDLVWKPLPFKLETGKTIRYIDFDAGSDDNDGTKDKPWKHHPWDPSAGGKAKAQSGPTTYVFKRGVVYRGELVPGEGGTDAEPVRLTSDPAWGKGEAIISGAEKVAKWTKGADRAEIPEAANVWWADLDFSPRCVWTVTGEASERVELARSPNWKVSDPEDVKSEWWRFQQPNWWENNMGKWKIDFNGHRAHLGVDTEHLTQPADTYVGAIAHVEYGIVMGTPFPTTIEGYDPNQKGIIFQGIWWGDSENILANCRYFLEDKPQFLDSAGEFWFDKKGPGDAGRLYLRLPGDKDPNTADVEVAKRVNLLEASKLEHVAVTGLTFRHTNIHWDLVQPPWAHPDIDNAAIRVRGAAVDVRIANCRFLDVAKAIRIDTAAYDPEKRKDEPFDRIVVSDNDIDRTDHGAITIKSHGMGDVKVLRNHLHLIGLRTFRQDHSHALDVEWPETMDVSGNILERCTGAGLFLFGGKGGGTADAALVRNLVHHNKAVDTLLSADDWGGIETWFGGPFYNYSNISANPNGLWWAYDPNKPGSARLGFAYYHDHGYKNYDFNDIAIGGSDDWKSKNACQAAFYGAGPLVQNSLVNCTVYRFWTASQWSPSGGRGLFLGNVFDDIGGQAFQHGQLKEDKGEKPANYPHESMAYSRNVFSGIAEKNFAVYESNGKGYDDPEAMSKSFAEHPALASDVGVLAKESPLKDPAKGDLRPKPGSAAIDHGVKAFVPWALARTVGEWQFRRDNADPTTLLDDHWYMAPFWTGDSYAGMPVNTLKGQGIDAKSFGPGPLEDWCDGALTLDGKAQYAVEANADMSKPFAYQVGNDKKTAQGTELSTPDVDKTSLIVEAYVQPKAAGTVLVSKLADSGYQLAVNKAGGVTFTVVGGGGKSEVASGAKITDGKWHHVLAELDRAAGTLTIYTDGRKTADAKSTIGDASLSNQADFLVGARATGNGAKGNFYAGSIDFLRVARSSLAESKTSIEELYDWEFDGPFLRDFAGKEPTGKGRDAGAFEGDGK